MALFIAILVLIRLFNRLTYCLSSNLTGKGKESEKSDFFKTLKIRQLFFFWQLISMKNERATIFTCQCLWKKYFLADFFKKESDFHHAFLYFPLGKNIIWLITVSLDENFLFNRYTRGLIIISATELRRKCQSKI